MKAQPTALRQRVKSRVDGEETLPIQASSSSNPLIVPAQRRELPLTCCARTTFAALVLLSLLTLIAALFAAFYAHEAHARIDQLTNVSSAAVAATHHQRAMDVGRALHGAN